MMRNTELALVVGAAFAGLAFVLAIPRAPTEEFSSPTSVPAQVLTDKSDVLLASDWKWPIAEEADIATTESAESVESAEPTPTDDSQKKRCHRRRCR